MRFSRVAVASVACSLAAIVVVGCTDVPPPTTQADEADSMFGAREAKLHPVFTKLADFDANGTIDGIDALVELHDQFGDTTKGAGTFTFELYNLKFGQPDPRGERLSNPWVVDVVSADAQRERWSRAGRCYTFRLAEPTLNRATSYVLALTFAPVGGGPRSFDRIVLVGVPATQPSDSQNNPNAPSAAGTPSNGSIDTTPGPAAPGPTGTINSLPPK